MRPKACETRWFVALLIASMIFAPRPAVAQDRTRQISDAEAAEAREIVQKFTNRFLEAKDLTPILNELYVGDFMERYQKFRSDSADYKDAAHIYFVPGLDYDSRLLREAGVDDWRRFYVAANNFIFFGFLSVIKKFPKDIENLKAADIYPASVIALLHKNPNLANLIQKEGPTHPVSSVEEMRNATAVLEQANAVMRQNLHGKPAARIENNALLQEMKQVDRFKPALEIMEDEFFGFPKGTALVLVTTPLLFQLKLVKIEGRFRILWADPYVGD